MGDITTDIVTTQTTKEDTKEGGGKKRTATEVAGQNIDDVAQILIQDLHHRSGEETDHGRQSQEGIDHGHHSQEETGRDHQLLEGIGRPHQLEDETALTDRQDGDQFPQKNVEELDQRGNETMCDHGEEIRHRSIPDLRHQNDGDHQTVVLLTL
jgi:hypothetical protein